MRKLFGTHDKGGKSRMDPDPEATQFATEDNQNLTTADNDIYAALTQT